MISKQGWINLYKPKNITSFKAINSIKKKFSINKIGHAGTLDPMAEGVLPIAIGKATKLIPYISNTNKEYEFSVTWGTQTTTDDAEGKILFESNYLPKRKEIEKKIIDYIGYINQTPPKVSAVKINGKRAYKLFRENKKFKEKLSKYFNVSILSTSNRSFSDITLLKELILSAPEMSEISPSESAGVVNVLISTLKIVGYITFNNCYFASIKTSLGPIDPSTVTLSIGFSCLFIGG